MVLRMMDPKKNTSKPRKGRSRFKKLLFRETAKNELVQYPIKHRLITPERLV